MTEFIFSTVFPYVCKIQCGPSTIMKGKFTIVPGKSRPLLDPFTDGSDRLLELAIPALTARLGNLGEGREPETLTSTKQSTGQGLAQAIEQALHSATPTVETVYASPNGESYYAFEWGIVLTRLHETLQTMKTLIHPADCVGDVGAATGALLLTCAASNLQQQPTSAPQSLLWTASDTDHRMALTLQKG